MIVVALDPGTTTGWADFIEHIGEGQSHWLRLQLGPDSHNKVLWDRLRHIKPDHIVCESFTYQVRPDRRKVVLDSVEYIGVARLYSQVTDTPLHMQSPSQAKGLWTDDKLRSLGLWIPNHPHSMDATRHLLYFMTITLKDLRWVQELRTSAVAREEHS